MAKLETFNFSCACALWHSAVSCLYSHAVSFVHHPNSANGHERHTLHANPDNQWWNLESFANLGKVCSILTICVWLLCLAYPIKGNLYCRSKFSDREVLKLFSVRWLGVVNMMFKYSPWLKGKGWHVTVHG